MLETDADRAAYVAAFGVSVVCDQGIFSAIFDNSYLLSGELNELAPVLELQTASVLAYGLREGIAVSIDQKPYKVRRHEPDGTGMSKLILDG